jgi:hypothetical protein
MKSEEYAAKYLEKLKSGVSVKPEKDPEELEFVKKVLLELLNDLHKEMLKTAYDRNISVKNYDQWSKVIPLARDYNDKCNAIFRKMNMPGIVDLYKNQIGRDTPTMVKLWNMSKEEIDKFAKEARESNKTLLRFDNTKKC